ncbi:MAG: hypothetical protein CL823_06040 [Crocinitomicaceae bacterium]|nr:hypothetical protein [Crocinitomicaceae bacterium]|tara:strand:+ start:2389 stop:3357 length:969 start_codon:yes stop_codon:yes gene_type:complete
MLRSILPLFLVAILTLTGCVTMKQFEELQDSCEEIDHENTELRLGAQDAQIENRELKGSIETLTKAREQLAADTARMGRFVSEAEDEISRLRDLNDALTDQNGGRLSQLNEENRALLEDVGRIRTELQTREDSLLALAADLAQRSADLESRSARVEELESLLAARDRAADVLRSRLQKALLGFEGNGLTVEQRDGKVYVSLEAALLFASGSADVDESGREILMKLGDVIATQQDLEIIVEGHTDTDKLSSTSIPRNNWELSVIRATSVLEIIMGQPGVDPSILTASGRGEFHPVDLEDKSKNRRIEVVLAPKLDDLFELLEE